MARVQAGRSRTTQLRHGARPLRRGLIGLWLIGTTGLSPSVLAQNTKEDPPTTPPTTPREIIDRLIAEPPAGVDHTVSPSRTDRTATTGAGTAVDAAGSPGGLSPDVVQIDPDAPLPRLRREGGFVVERPGRLIAVPDPSAPAASGAELWVFAFDRVPGVDDLRPMIVQKTQRLQVMQDMRGTRTTSDTPLARGRLIGNFLISGQVHTYRGVNFLLPSAVVARPDAATAALLKASSPRSPAVTSEPADAAPRGLSPATGDAFESGGGATPSTFGGDDDPIRQMEALLTRPEGATATPGDPGVGTVAEGLRSDAGGDNAVIAAPRPEGSYLVERRGRVVGGHDGGPVLFTFSADGAEADDPPVVLMPCGLLDELEAAVRAADVAPEFALSGRVYAYRGVNYVLPTSYRTVPRRDNLGD